MVAPGQLLHLVKVQAHGFGDPAAIFFIGPIAMYGVAVLDVVRYGCDVAGGVVDQDSALVLRHQAVQLAAGAEAIVGGVLLGVIGVQGALQIQRGLHHVGLGRPGAQAVGGIGRRAAVVAVHPHGAVAVVVAHRAAGLVHGDLVVVDAQAVALGIAVDEQAALEEFVRREADAGHHMGGGEGGLLHLGKVVFGVAVEHQLAHFNQREFLMTPDLGDIEGVFIVLFGLFFRHDLHIHGPAGEVAPLDGFKQVAPVAFPVVGDQLGGLLVAEVFDALLGAEMELDPHALIGSVVEAEGVLTKKVHVAEGGGNAPIRHDDGGLVEGFGQHGPKIPVVLGGAHAGAGVALDGPVQVGEVVHIPQEKGGGVVAHQVPVALFRIEFAGYAADVALGIGGAALAGHGGKADEYVGLFAHLGEQLGLCVWGDIVGDGEGAVGAPALGVHAALGDDLTVKMGQLFQQPHILQGNRAPGAGRQRVFVFGHGGAHFVGQFFIIHILSLLI